MELLERGRRAGRRMKGLRIPRFPRRRARAAVGRSGSRDDHLWSRPRRVVGACVLSRAAGGARARFLCRRSRCVGDWRRGRVVRRHHLLADRIRGLGGVCRARAPGAVFVDVICGDGAGGVVAAGGGLVVVDAGGRAVAFQSPRPVPGPISGRAGADSGLVGVLPGSRRSIRRCSRQSMPRAGLVNALRRASGNGRSPRAAGP